jgi:hypothetical protein
MPSKKKPWRTVIVGGDTGRFTWDEIHAAVRAVREARERNAAKAERRRQSAGGVSVAGSGRISLDGRMSRATSAVSC